DQHRDGRAADAGGAASHQNPLAVERSVRALHAHSQVRMKRPLAGTRKSIRSSEVAWARIGSPPAVMIVLLVSLRRGRRTRLTLARQVSPPSRWMLSARSPVRSWARLKWSQ